MKCNCSKNCIISKKEVLKNIEDRYTPCPDCNTKKIKKSIPIKKQLKLENVNSNYNKCSTCGKRHIDVVMSHILKIMIENKQLTSTSSIRKVGTPLITPALNLKRSPYMNNNSLVLLTPNTDKKTAKQIYNEVPEVKGVIKGDINNTVGQLNESTDVHQYTLLSGCDIRCDVQNTPYGEIVLYKPQSLVHIEYPKEQSPKIVYLDKILEKYDNPTVIDAMSGSGTLGIYSLMKNAKKVLFNDIYEPAIDTTKLNLKINNISENNYEIINKNIHDLPKKINEKYDIGIIDAFPGINIDEYKKSLEKICSEIIVI